MRKSTVVILVGIAVITIIGGGVWYFTRPRLTDRQKIVRVIRDVKKAVVRKNAAGILEHISDDYDDGTWTKPQIRGLVYRGMRTAQNYNVHIEPPELTVRDDTATAHINARFWTGRGPPTDATSLDIEVEFVKQDGHWKVISATGWEPATDSVP